MSAYAYLGILIIAAAGAWYGWGTLTDMIRAPVKAELEACVAGRDTLDGAVKRQNDSLERLAAASKAQADVSEKAVKLALAGQREAAARAAALSGAKPEKPDDLCESARILSMQQIGKAK